MYGRKDYLQYSKLIHKVFVTQHNINIEIATNAYMVEQIQCIKQMKVNNRKYGKRDIRQFLVPSNIRNLINMNNEPESD